MAAAGILANFFFVSWKAGKYIERVERLTNEVERYQDKVDSLQIHVGKIRGRLKMNGE